MLFAGSIAALVHLKLRGPRACCIGFVLFAAAAAINLLLAAIGMVMVAQARVRGGDRAPCTLVSPACLASSLHFC